MASVPLSQHLRPLLRNLAVYPRLESREAGVRPKCIELRPVGQARRVWTSEPAARDRLIEPVQCRRAVTAQRSERRLIIFEIAPIFPPGARLLPRLDGQTAAKTAQHGLSVSLSPG